LNFVGVPPSNAATMKTILSLLTALLLVPLAAVTSRHWKTSSRKLPMVG
jgi:hypothetical protein